MRMFALAKIPQPSANRANLDYHVDKFHLTTQKVTKMLQKHLKVFDIGRTIHYFKIYLAKT